MKLLEDFMMIVLLYNERDLLGDPVIAKNYSPFVFNYTIKTNE